MEKSLPNVPLDVSSLGQSQTRRRSLKGIQVVQAFESNRIVPAEAKHDAIRDIETSQENKKEEMEKENNYLFSLKVNLDDQKQQALYAFLGVIGLIMGGVWAAGYFLVPWSNIFETDGFSYELLAYMTLFYCPVMATKMFYNAYYINGYRWDNPYKVWVLHLLAASFGWGAAIVFLHMYQTMIRELCPPFPMITSVAIVPGALWFSQTILWFQYPGEIRKQKIFRKRYFRFITSFFPLQFIPFLIYNTIIPIGFMLLPTDDLQWIMALILPLFREFCVWGFTKFYSKHAEERDKKPIEIMVLHDFATRHALALSIMANTLASVQTSFLLIGIDFAINIFLAINIIRKKRTNPEVDVDQDVQELMMAEKIEFVIPLLFYLTFVMGYYGPNGDLFGGLRLMIFERQALLDPESVTKWTTIFFLIDFGSLIVSVILLWVFCRINCFPHYLKISAAFWLIMAVQETHWMNEVRYTNLLNNS